MFDHPAGSVSVESRATQSKSRSPAAMLAGYAMFTLVAAAAVAGVDD